MYQILLDNKLLGSVAGLNDFYESGLAQQLAKDLYEASYKGMIKRYIEESEARYIASNAWHRPYDHKQDPAYKIKEDLYYKKRLQIRHASMSADECSSFFKQVLQMLTFCIEAHGGLHVQYTDFSSEHAYFKEVLQMDKPSTSILKQLEKIDFDFDFDL